MKFLLQSNLSEGPLTLGNSVFERFPHEYVKLIPFTREVVTEQPLEGDGYIPYGSTLLTSIAYERKWKGLHFDLSLFNYEAAVNNRDDMLNDELIFTVQEAIEFCQDSNPDKEWFIRPSEDLKQFSGQVFSAEEIRDWFLDAISLPPDSGTYYMPKDLKVVLAEPKKIYAEWRWFIVGGKVINGANYRLNGRLVKNSQPETDKEIIQTVQKMADIWLPDACVVMDTALVQKNMYVIEFNCINSSGFYGHCIEDIVSALYNYHN